MNRTVKLYCSVKRPSGDWGTKPVPDMISRLSETLEAPKREWYIGPFSA